MFEKIDANTLTMVFGVKLDRLLTGVIKSRDDFENFYYTIDTPFEIAIKDLEERIFNSNIQLILIENIGGLDTVIRDYYSYNQWFAPTPEEIAEKIEVSKKFLAQFETEILIPYQYLSYLCVQSQVEYYIRNNITQMDEIPFGQNHKIISYFKDGEFILEVWRDEILKAERRWDLGDMGIFEYCTCANHSCFNEEIIKPELPGGLKLQLKNRSKGFLEYFFGYYPEPDRKLDMYDEFNIYKMIDQMELPPKWRDERFLKQVRVIYDEIVKKRNISVADLIKSSAYR